MGLGRQRSVSAGEDVRYQLYPHQHPHPPADRPHSRERHGIHPAHPDVVAGVRTEDYRQGDEEEMRMGKGIGRQRSRSAGANVVTHPHEETHEIAFADTHPLPLALVNK
jgi:hypothetical protein